MNDEFYEKAGKKYERVTNILRIIHDPGLEQLRRVKGFSYVDRIFQEAADRGKAFHSAMKIVANGQFKDMIQEAFKQNHPDIYQDILNCEEWFNENVVKVLYSEDTFYDDKYRFAGTPDLIAILKGDKKPAIIDYKTGSKILPIHKLQLAGYTHLVEDSTNLKIGKRIILHARDGKIKLIQMKAKKELDITLFHYVLYLHKNLK